MVPSPRRLPHSISRSHPLTRRQTHGSDRMNRAERDTVVGSGSLVTLDPGATKREIARSFPVRPVGTIAGARRLIRSANSGESAANLVIGKDRTFCRFPRKNPYEGFPENARWNAERQAVEFGVEIGEYRGVVRVPRRVFQRLLPERPTGSAVR
jgi:hypothetical protein